MNTLWSMIARLAPGGSSFFGHFRYKKTVRCPESDQPAEILVDASPGSPLKPKKKLFSIRNYRMDRRNGMNTLFTMLARLARAMGSRYRYKKTVKCPESDRRAEILVDASPGSPSKPKKKRSAYKLRSHH